MAPTASLRFDGIYTTGDAAAVAVVFRFYADKTVLAASTDRTTLEALLRWFKKGHEHSGVGTYEIEGNRIRFSEKTRYGAIDHVGTIDGETIELRWHSHIDGADGAGTFRFMKADVQ